MKKITYNLFAVFCCLLPIAIVLAFIAVCLFLPEGMTQSVLLFVLMALFFVLTVIFILAGLKRPDIFLIKSWEIRKEGEIDGPKEERVPAGRG